MQDLLEEIGVLGLASRLKRLSDALMQDGVRVYQTAGAGFEPRWFPVFLFLYHRGPTAITEIARGVGVSHPAVNKVANELIAARLVAPYRDRKDKRKRVLALTSAGRDKAGALEPVWSRIETVLQEIVDEAGGNFPGALQGFERSLQRCGLHDRFAGQR